MKAVTMISAFLGGALVGCATAMLFAPEKGEVTRERLVNLLRKRGLKISDKEVDALVAELSGE